MVAGTQFKLVSSDRPSDESRTPEETHPRSWIREAAKALTESYKQSDARQAMQQKADSLRRERDRANQTIYRFPSTNAVSNKKRRRIVKDTNRDFHDSMKKALEKRDERDANDRVYAGWQKNLKGLIKTARDDIKSEIKTDKRAARQKYAQETEHLHFWNIAKRSRARTRLNDKLKEIKKREGFVAMWQATRDRKELLRGIYKQNEAQQALDDARLNQEYLDLKRSARETRAAAIRDAHREHKDTVAQNAKIQRDINRHHSLHRRATLKAMGLNVAGAAAGTAAGLAAATRVVAEATRDTIKNATTNPSARLTS